MLAFLFEPLTWFVTRRYLYHVDKAAHTALLTFCLGALAVLIGHPVSLYHCAQWAAVMYFTVGKVAWYTSASYRRQVTGGGWAFVTWRDYLPAPEIDWLSDLALSWFVVILAAAFDGHRLGWVQTLWPPVVYLYAVARRQTSP